MAARSLDDLLHYRSQLLDYATRRPIDSTSKLAYLHQPDHLLQALSCATIPEPCSLVLSSVIFPTHQALTKGVHARYQFTTSFVRLLTAPALRLKCTWSGIHHPQSTHAGDCFSVSLDFHLTSGADGEPGAQDLHVQNDIDFYGHSCDEIQVNVNKATSEGFNNVPLVEGKLEEHGREMVAVLRNLIKPDEPIPIRLRLKVPLFHTSLADVLPFVTGEGAEKLPSLSFPEWHAFPMKPNRTIEELVYCETPFPMTPQSPSNTYATVPQAAVELFESSRIAHLEQEIMLQEWSNIEHYAALIQLGGVVLAVVRFGGMSNLADGFDLPESLQATISWVDPTGDSVCGQANRCAFTLRLPIAYDALFVFPDPKQTIREACMLPTEVDLRRLFPVTFKPVISRFTVEKQLETAVNIQHPDSARWHPLILNQDHAQDCVDIAAKRISDSEAEPLSAEAETEIDEAFDWVLLWREWNEEQLEALHSIRSCVGGVSLCTAPAGCGKTLLLQAVCYMLYKLGLHVLVLCPANSNCTDFMTKMTSNFEDDPSFRATRVYPSSADRDARRFLDGDHSSSNLDAQDQGSTDYLEMELIRADIQASGEKYSSFASYGLPAQVLQAARDEEYSHVSELNGRKVDVWKELKEILESNDNGTFSWNSKEVARYQATYEACKSYFVAVSRMIVTTTGNLRTDVIVDSFAQDKHESKCKGVVVIVDEACKDREIDTLSALVLPSIRKKITGFIMLGDERQLEPMNRSARTSLNPFAHRLSLPLLTRLKREGFPCTELVEQHRMHTSISEWPSRNFYSSTIRDGPGTHQHLQMQQPGLFACLTTILANLGTGMRRSSDADVRTQYLETYGRRDNSTRSIVCREHIKAFFNEVFPYLLAYYGEKLSENVMVICAYKKARNCWLDAVHYLQRQYKIPTKQMPLIMTIDSSQGSEASICVVDASVQKYTPHGKSNGIGFVDDDKRMNVAFTRAQDVRWVIGGSCSVGTRPRGLPSETPAYVRYREESKSKAVCKVKDQWIADWEGDWLKELKKKDVKLTVTFADDMAR